MSNEKEKKITSEELTEEQLEQVAGGDGGSQKDSDQTVVYHTRRRPDGKYDMTPSRPL